MLYLIQIVHFTGNIYTMFKQLIDSSRIDLINYQMDKMDGKLNQIADTTISMKKTFDTFNKPLPSMMVFKSSNDGLIHTNVGVLSISDIRNISNPEIFNTTIFSMIQPHNIQLVLVDDEVLTENNIDKMEYTTTCSKLIYNKSVKYRDERYTFSQYGQDTVDKYLTRAFAPSRSTIQLDEITRYFKREKQILQEYITDAETDIINMKWYRKITNIFTGYVKKVNAHITEAQTHLLDLVKDMQRIVLVTERHDIKLQSCVDKNTQMDVMINQLYHSTALPRFNKIVNQMKKID